MRLAILLLVLSLTAQAETSPTHLVGQAFDLDSGALLYTENHTFEYDSDGQPVADEVIYLDPDGEQIGRKVLDFRPNLFLPNFLTTLDHSGYQEGLRREGDTLILQRRKSKSEQMQEKSLSPDKCDAGDAGFHPFVQANFERVLAGETVRFRFCAPGNLTSVAFKASRLEDGDIDGFRTVRVRVEVASLLGWFVDPLTLSYNPENRDLIEYIGISNVRDKQGKAYNTRIVYPIRSSQQPDQTE